MKPITFEQYIRDNDTKNIIDFAIRTHVTEAGVSFYIHPANTGGDTLDFIVSGNELDQLHVDLN